MDSFFARNRLSAFLDGGLSDAESAAVAEAIEQDPELKAEFDALRRAVELLRREGPVEAPRGFHARVMAELPGDRWAPRTVIQLRRAFTRVPVEAAALAAAALVVVIVLGRQPEDIPAPPSAPVLTPAAAPATAPPVTGPPPPAATASPAAEPEAAPEPAAAPQKGAQKKGDTRKASGKKGSKEATQGTYVADWEQGGDGAARPFGYRVSLSDREVLYALSVLAERNGGQMLDSAGRRVKPWPLTTESNYAQIQLMMPASAANKVHGQLRALGGVEGSPPSTTLTLDADHVGFVVEVTFMP